MDWVIFGLASLGPNGLIWVNQTNQTNQTSIEGDLGVISAWHDLGLLGYDQIGFCQSLGQCALSGPNWMD